MRVNTRLRKIVNNCLIYEPKRRPTFEHILAYFEKIEKCPKYETVAPLINNLSDFFFKN